MSKHNVVELSGRETGRGEVTELIRDGARKLISEALEAVARELLSGFSERRDASRRSAVVRNGYQPERDIQTGIGPVTVKVPKVRSRDGNPVSFRSALVPPYVRKSARLEAALPWLYLKGISTGERPWCTARGSVALDLLSCTPACPGSGTPCAIAILRVISTSIRRNPIGSATGQRTKPPSESAAS